MDHSLDTVDLVRPWRTATLVVSLVAAVELIVLIVAAVVIVGEPVARKLESEATQRAVAPAPQPRDDDSGKPTLERAETSVLVLNGNGRPGAAAAAGASVHAKGYVVGGVGNAPRTDYPRSIVMYRPGYEAEARRLARDVGIDAVGPLDGMSPRSLMGAHVALIIGY